MKKLTLVLLTAAVVFGASFSAQAQTKVASVDMKKLFNGYWKFKQSSTILEDRKTSLNKDLKSQTEELAKKQADYKRLLEQASDPLISADEREKRKTAASEKAREVNDAKINLEQFQRQAETSVVELEQRLSGNLIGEIQQRVAAKAKAGGYQAVLNQAATEIVVYSDSAIDITDSVLKDLNAGAPADWQKSQSTLPTTLKPK